MVATGSTVVATGLPGERGLNVTSAPRESTDVHCEEDGHATPRRNSPIPPVRSSPIGLDHVNESALAAAGWTAITTTSAISTAVASRIPHLKPLSPSPTAARLRRFYITREYLWPNIGAYKSP
jgi:hypothetical protein